MRIGGIDVGRLRDHTAVVVLDGWTVRIAERFPLGLKFAEINEQLDLYVERCDRVFVDATGVGDPVREHLVERHGSNKVTGVKIIHGENASVGGLEWRVPKSMLAGALRHGFDKRKIKIGSDCPEEGRDALRAELVDFMQLSHHTPKFEARSGSHDDLVLALALATFGKLAR